MNVWQPYVTILRKHGALDHIIDNRIWNGLNYIILFYNRIDKLFMFKNDFFLLFSWWFCVLNELIFFFVLNEFLTGFS